MTEIVLSAVVQLLSAFDGRPIEVGHPKFRIDATWREAQPKPQGFYAFTGLDEGSHELEVALAGFFPARAALTVPTALPLADSIVACALEPAPCFPYPEWAAVLRGCIFAAGSPPLPLPGARVVATYAGRDDREKRVTTMSADGGPYDGHYALALPGRRRGVVDVTVTFSSGDHDEHLERLTLEPGRTVFLDVTLA